MRNLFLSFLFVVVAGASGCVGCTHIEPGHVRFVEENNL